MKRLLSKEKIARIHKQAANPTLKQLCRMAEFYRQYARAKAKRAKAKPKKYLKSTDYLTAEQFGRIMSMLYGRTGRRADVNKMLIVFAAETGMRPSEVINVNLCNLPHFHGKPEIEVFDGKGNKDRTVGISDFLVRYLDKFIAKYHKNHSATTPLFLSENKTRMSYASFNAKVKTIGRIAGIWLSGNKSRLTPHKFRHTFATLLLDVTDNEILIKNQLGHDQLTTTTIYTRTLSEKLRCAMNNFHNRLFQSLNAPLFDNL